ncbi:PD-(D/E)XK nuclease superfamily protein [Sinomicrobium oceani]|uniref:PD-(D/E)XK nuclease superfamily protein n=1 Tax=Sinomicrobium oceani TaxID=1150368 RepID=A0A1K1Q3X3_9FLAO|nr:PD-(D/E)XK nuclease family protein [Sinomicrobium oceani]SFW54608.1 PD-(D/E)XK nuclease superfamily protein [Sinomicrobium oceani]
MEYKILFDKVRTIVRHHNELKRLKGENFNIFDVLNLQTNEVRTHSAFLAELLNPKGSHLMGTVFLKAFLETIRHDNNFTTKDENLKFDTSTAIVNVEVHIGTITTETGGRIDILLEDRRKNTITIENKIDACDQDNQILRYYNYNHPKNTVYYLNKYGDEPSIESKKHLKSETDFHIISYRHHIISWLEKCHTLAADQPILRESIKQYQILIKKLTNTLENKQKMELHQLIVNNLEEAELIARNYDSVLAQIRDTFRNALLKALKQYQERANELKDYEIKINKTVNATYSGIWIPQKENSNKMFGICSFSGQGHLEGTLFVGLYSKDPIITKELSPINSNKDWRHYQNLTYDYNGSENKIINCSDKAFLKYVNHPENLKKVVSELTKQIITFIEAHAGDLGKNKDSPSPGI